jgi:hypothetical protein
MNFTAIVSGIFAIAKAIPKVKEMLDSLLDLWLTEKLSRLDKKYGEKDHELRTLVNAVKGAKTNEDRMALSRLLFKYKSGKL